MLFSSSFQRRQWCVKQSPTLPPQTWHSMLLWPSDRCVCWLSWHISCPFLLCRLISCSISSSIIIVHWLLLMLLWRPVAANPQNVLHRQTSRSRIRRWIVRNVQTLIVSAVKVCKQCLQTASASPDLLPALDPHWETSVPQTLWAIAPKWKSMPPPLKAWIYTVSQKSFHLNTLCNFVKS